MNSCGTCTACCTVMPVSGIGKPAYQACRHLMQPDMLLARPRVGCAIYAARPHECRQWQCGWLKDNLPPELRPDRLGIVIDTNIDLFQLNGRKIACAQFWLLPGREEAVNDKLVMRLVSAVLFAPDNHGVGGVLFRNKADRATAMWRNPDDPDDKRIHAATTDRLSKTKIGNAAQRFIEAQRIIHAAQDERDVSRR